MFADHQYQLARLGRRDVDGFERVCTFVLLTIRQPLRIACMDYKLVRNGDERPLFGSKRDGLAYVRQHAAELLDDCERAYYNAHDDIEAENDILDVLTRIPSIGTAKGGFICQMLYGLSGCIDTHNIKRFGVTETTFKLRKEWKRERKLQLIADYNRFCRRQGGTAALWDGWCEYVSRRDPANYETADLVSSLHLVPLEC